MLKTLIFLGLIFGIIWFFFIRKPKKVQSNNQEESMVQCCKCQTFVLQNEAILSNGRYYCSNECLFEGQK